MNSIRFQYRADLYVMGETTDIEDEGCECDAAQYPVDNDMGKYGSLGKAALAELKSRMPTPKPGSRWRVMLSGRLIFSQDYYGETDMDVEVEWASVSESEYEEDSVEEGFEFLDGNT